MGIDFLEFDLSKYMKNLETFTCFNVEIIFL